MSRRVLKKRKILLTAAVYVSLVIRIGAAIRVPILAITEI